MRFSFVLVEPLLPENVGSCARAIKTMGFDELRLVNSCSHQGERAKWLAYGSGDILEKASVFPDLSTAVSDSDLVIGTTARPRKRRRDVMDAQELVRLLDGKKKTTDRVALVFGREDRGLTNEELDRCDLVSSIPMGQPYPSLNLAQAVLVYSYVLSPLTEVEKRKSEPADRTILASLKHRVRRLFRMLDIQPDSTLYRQLMDRLNSGSDEDVKLLFALVQKMESRFDSKMNEPYPIEKSSMTVSQ